MPNIFVIQQLRKEKGEANIKLSLWKLRRVNHISNIFLYLSLSSSTGRRLHDAIPHLQPSGVHLQRANPASGHAVRLSRLPRPDRRGLRRQRMQVPDMRLRHHQLRKFEWLGRYGRGFQSWVFFFFSFLFLFFFIFTFQGL